MKKFFKKYILDPVVVYLSNSSWAQPLILHRLFLEGLREHVNNLIKSLVKYYNNNNDINKVYVRSEWFELCKLRTPIKRLHKYAIEYVFEFYDDMSKYTDDKQCTEYIKNMMAYAKIALIYRKAKIFTNML